MDQRFTTITWGSFGEGSQGCPFGVLAGGFADGTVKLYNPAKAFQTRFQDSGVLYSKQVHAGPVLASEFHPLRPNLMVTGGYGEVAESGRPGRAELRALKGRTVGCVGCPPNWRTSGKPPTF